RAVAAQLEEVVEHALDVVERIGPVCVAREQDALPDLLVGRLGRQPVELLLQPLELRGQLRAAQQPDAGELAQPLAQTQLGLGRHGANRRSSLAIVGRSCCRGTIASMWPKRRFCSARPKSSGSFSRVVCWTTRGPANDISAPGSARSTSPRLAKLASRPPVVGCVSTEISAQPASCSSSTAQTVFGSCIRARMPSC